MIYKLLLAAASVGFIIALYSNINGYSKIWREVSHLKSRYGYISAFTKEFARIIHVSTSPARTQDQIDLLKGKYIKAHSLHLGLYTLSTAAAILSLNVVSVRTEAVISYLVLAPILATLQTWLGIKCMTMNAVKLETHPRWAHRLIFVVEGFFLLFWITVLVLLV